MKALTLHQPWASLVALGVKTIETRSWTTKYRGPLLIHAGKAKADPREPAWEPLLAEPGGALLREDVRPLPLGMIVASCTLADVVPIVGFTLNVPPPMIYTDRHGALIHWRSAAPESTGPLFFGGDWSMIEEERQFGDFTPGRFAWLLEDVKPTTERCPECWGDCRVFDDAPDGTREYRCSVCHGAGRCDPVPARGLQQLWEWMP